VLSSKLYIKHTHAVTSSSSFFNTLGVLITTVKSTKS